MTQEKRLIIAGLVVSALLGLPASGIAQSSYQSENQSTIFPALASKEKRDNVIFPEPAVTQGSRIRQSVFDQPESQLAMLGEPAQISESTEAQLGGGVGNCSRCGAQLDHPILGSCDKCMGPGQRLLYLMRPGRIFGGLAGPPIPREPWINRPFSAGVFVGPVVGSPLIDDWVGQQTGTLAGLRLGWDFDDDWGMELRLATANIPVYDSSDAIYARAQSLYTYPQQYMPYGTGTRNADHFIWDIDFLYYPWGDNSFRPYLLFGLGTDRIKFTDIYGTNYARILLGMPVGLGFKTHLNDWMIFRLECTDNIAIAGGSVFQTQHNFSLTGAFEVRLGRTKTMYWPWNPGR